MNIFDGGIIMAKVTPFRCVRPEGTKVSKIAALPYDVYSSKEAREVVKDNPLSFLNIDRAETQFDESVDIYDDKVYEKAHELLSHMIENGSYIRDNNKKYYIYRLVMDGRPQTGIVATVSLDDYLNNVVKKHENTREDKEQDRIRHVDVCNAQTGPIFLAYRSNDIINEIVAKSMAKAPIYDFVSEDGVGHTVWEISEQSDIDDVRNAFNQIEDIYIADGHHRAASAVKVGLKRRNENKNFTGEEEFNYFLSVLFPDNQLMIMDYNRTVADLNGHSVDEFMELVAKNFEIEKIGEKAYSPEHKGQFGMYLDGVWYRLSIKELALKADNPVSSLDVSMLQDYLLEPILGIKDPRTDSRIDFIGGIRGLSELEKRADSDMKVSFSMFPTSIGELFDVADANMLMPPKSTWFEPKLRSGIFIHELDY